MMFLDEREIARNASLAFDGDESSFGDVLRTQHESIKVAHEQLSKWNSYERSYDNDIETIEKVTGVKLDNPYRVGAYGTAEQMARGFTGSPADFFETKVRELADQHPDLKEHLRLDVPRQQKAIEIRNRALVEADDVWERYDGYGKYAAWLMAGLAASATDPLNIASMALGPWRTVAPGVQPVIMNALKVAGINMAAETIAQPWKRAWAEEAGQPWGWRESLLDIGSAGLFGFGLDAGVRGAFRGGQRLLGREPIIDEATRGVVGWRWPDRPKGAAQPPPKDQLKAAAEQDGAPSEPQGRPVEEPAAAAPEAPATDVLPDPTQDPAVRGAVTELERYMLFGRPPEVDDGEHLARLAAAIERADNPELPPPGNAIRGGADALAQDAEALDAIETTIREGFRRLKEDIAEDQRAQIRHALGKLGIDEAMSLEEALAHVRRSFVERSAELDLGPGGRAGRLSEGIRPGAEAQQTALPPTGSVGTTVQIEGRPVQFVRLADGAVPIDDDALALRTGDGAGVAVAFESADGRVTTQRIGGRRETGEAPGAWLFREADGWTIKDARAYAARENLRQMSGSAMDMAMLLRWRNDLATRDLPLTQYKFKQAQGLAALSDDAFDLVLDGVLPPQYAALVGDLVEDASRHADFIRQMAEADLRSQQQAKIFLGQLMIEPTAADVQMRVLGVGEAARELIAERSDVLARSLRLLDNDKRLFNVLNREAAKIEAAGNILDRDENAARAQLHKNLVNVIRALAEVQGPVNDLLQEAAAHVNRGVKPKIAAEAFVSRVVDLYDREGLNGLLRSRAAAVTLPKGKIDDPSGPELEAQVRSLEQARADAFDPYQFSLVRAMTEGGEQGLRARLARMTPDEIEDMARAQNIPLGEGDDIVTRLARGIEERIAQGRGPEEPPVRFATREDDDGIPDVGRRDRPEAAEGDRGVPPPAGDLTGRPRAEPGRVDAPRLAGDPDTTGRQVPFRLGGRDGRRVGLVGPNGRPQLFYVVFGEKAEVPSTRLTGRRAVDFLRELRQKIAWVRVDQTPQGRWYIGSVKVHARHRRRGIATHLYDGIEADLGIKLEPSFVLKPDGLAFWQRRNPEAVRHYRRYGDGYVSPQVLIARYAYLESAVERATTQAELNAILAEWDQVKRGLASLPPEAVTGDKIRFARPRAAADQQAAPDFLETLPKRYNLTPAASEAMPEIRAEIDKIFARLPEGIRSRVVGNIVYNGQQMAGVWDPYERLVGVVLSSKSPRYARHELWHVLEDLGYLTEAEVAVVRARAERDRLRDFYRIDERYLRQFSEQYRNDPLGAERALWSETFAEMLADFEQGRSFGPVVDKILRSVSRFIERIRNMLAGRGFQSVEDIFERILTTDEIRTRVTPHSIWVKAQRENAQRIGLEQIEAHIERAFSGPKFARVDDNLLAREAANLADSVSRFVEELKAGGRTFGEISQALKDRYGFEIPAAQLAAGEVWWRVPDVPGTRGLGVEPELEQKFRVTGQVPGSIERVSDSSDITARPPQPQRLSGRETPREFPRVVTRLNDEQKARIIDLWRANTSNARISEILTQEGGKYVPITSVISVVEQHIEAHPSRRALPLTETERAATSPEFAGMTARQIAEALTERTGRKVTPKAVYRARQRATQKGETVPELAGTGAPGSRIDPEWLHAGKFRWTDEIIATLKRDDIARLSAPDAAKVLNDLFSPDAPIVTANAVRLQRSKLGISKGKKAVRGEPRLMLRRGRWVIYDNNREIALKLPESAREEAEQRLAAYKAEKAKPDTLSDDPDVPGSMADAERVEVMATLAEACKR